MSSRDLYRRFTNICQKWPLDELKAGRDYGEFFRAQIGKHFSHAELSQVKDPKAVEAAISSLEKIVNNSYCRENPLKRSSASGLEAWACTESISNEGLKHIQEEGEATILNRLKNVLNMRFLDSKSDYKLNEEPENSESKIKEGKTNKKPD